MIEIWQGIGIVICFVLILGMTFSVFLFMETAWKHINQEQNVIKNITELNVVLDKEGTYTLDGNGESMIIGLKSSKPKVKDNG